MCGPAANCRGGVGGVASAATAGVPCARAYVENPAIELFETIAHFDDDVTATRIVCQCRGGTSVDFTWDDDTVAINASVTCTTSSGINDDTLDNTAIASGSDIDLDVTAVVGAVTDCSFFLYCE